MAGAALGLQRGVRGDAGFPRLGQTTRFLSTRCVEPGQAHQVRSWICCSHSVGLAVKLAAWAQAGIGN